MTLIPEPYHCPDCKDTGVYQGLNTVEPCRACGGKRTESITLKNASPETFILPVSYIVIEERPKSVTLSNNQLKEVAKTSPPPVWWYSGEPDQGSQTVSHEASEQVTEIDEVHISLTEKSLLEVQCDTREIDLGGMIRHELVNRHISLSAIQFDNEGVDRIRKAYTDKTPISVTCKFPDGSTGSVKASVSCWGVVFATMEGFLELIEGPSDA
jgi:hypothetical protein